MQLRFPWQDLRIDFFEFDANHGYDRLRFIYLLLQCIIIDMIEACPTCLGYVFGNSSYCRILHQDFCLMQMDLYPDLEVSMGNYLRIFLAEVWSQ